MSQVNATQSASGALPHTGLQQVSDAADLNNEFLTLMVAQIQNQDPLNPLDGSEYVAQLAQLSQVESSENMVALLNQNNVMMENLQVFSTASLVGQQVWAQTSQIEVGEQSIPMNVSLNASTDNFQLFLTDDAGQVTSLSFGPREAGRFEISLDPNTHALAKGSYGIAADQAAVEVGGEVARVNLPNGGGSALVSVDGIGWIPYYQIRQFGQ